MLGKQGAGQMARTSLQAYLRRHPDPLAARNLHLWEGPRRDRDDPFRGLSPLKGQSAEQRRTLDKLLKDQD